MLLVHRADIIKPVEIGQRLRIGLVFYNLFRNPEQKHDKLIGPLHHHARTVRRREVDRHGEHRVGAGERGDLGAGGVEPGVLPPISAWWPRAATNQGHRIWNLSNLVVGSEGTLALFRKIKPLGLKMLSSAPKMQRSTVAAPPRPWSWL